MTRTERFFKMCEALNISKYDLHAKLHLFSRSTIYRWSAGECEPTLNKLSAFFEKFPQASKDYFLEESGPMFIGEGDFSIPKDVMEVIARKAAKANLETTIPVKLVTAKASATFVESLYGAEDPDDDTYPIVAHAGENLTSGDYAVFEVLGDSMSPSILNGSKVLAERVSESMWEYVNGVVIVVYGKQMVIKRVLANNLFSSNSIILSSDNTKFGQFIVQRSDIRAIFKVRRKVDEEVI
jgi:hypothetical protein